ncbi:MAG: SBBP repeat-containing protein [Chitinophagales bacterium]
MTSSKYEVGFIIVQLALIILAVSNVIAQPTATWVFQYNGEGDYNDRYTCITTDGSGNIYTGGSTVNIGNDRDCLIQKMDASGNVIWRAMFNASGNGPDEVLAIIVDASQNVYTTGFGKSADVGNDFLTIKLNSTGTILWSKFYNNDQANGYDQANSIALDGDGNVIVTGQSDEDETAFTNDDYLTIKYSNDGSELWTARYNGLGNETDRAVKTVTDNSNNIYITGRSFNGNDDDYVTIKYDAGGTEQWHEYGDRTHNDRAQAMAIDANNNIYVTGWSSNGTNHDYYTIKYNSSGAQQWAKVYDFVDDDEVTAITVDASGLVYITGQSDGDATPFVNYNYLTIKYNVSGAQQWASSYEGTGGNDDIPTSISVSGSNIFVTGFSDADATPVVAYDIATVEYSSSGSQVWAQEYAGSGGYDDVGNSMTVDGDGNVFIAGYEEDNNIQRNALVVKYDNTGSQLFANSFNGTGDNSDNVRDIKMDAQGNIYLAGYSVRRVENRDFFSIKLTAQGDTLWTKYINGTTPGSEDEAQVCAIDNNDNLLVAGFTKNSGTSGDYTLVKMDAATGDSLWLRFYDSPTHEYDKAYDMQIDAAGNSYLTGRTDSDPTINSNDEATTVKYSPAGDLLWTVTYAGAGNGADRGSFIQLSEAGNVYVTGRTFNGTNNDILLIKYDNNGTQQWVRTYNNGFGSEEAKGMLIDGNENIYITGNSASAGDSSDIVTLKYSSAGDFQWEKRINNGGGDEANGITMDLDGNLIITGTTDADNSAVVNLNTVTAKYNASGNQIWLQSFDGTNHLDDIADAVLADQFGNVYLSMHSNNGSASDLNFDIVIIRYNSDGSQAWQTSWGGSSDTLDAANTLYLLNNDLFVAGSTWQNNQQRNMLVIKYSMVTGIATTANNNETVSVFPDPFNDFIIVTTTDNSEKQVELQDVTGKLVFQKSFSQSQITFPVTEQLTPGIYLCKVISNNQVIHTQKIICQR